MSEIYKKIEDELFKLMGEDRVLKNVSMKEYTSFRAGGDAALFLSPENREQLEGVLRLLAKEGLDYFVIGNGSNILVKDEGYNGAIVHIGPDMAKVSVDGTCITAEAGALLSVTSKTAASHGLSGLEFAAGIPGSIGGGVFMNAGAYGGEMSRVVDRVTALSIDGKKEYNLSCAEMEFGYRKSKIEETGGVIVEVRLVLEKANKEKIQSKMKELAAKRCEKQPLNLPSAGSFFKRPPGHYAGRLIEDAGLKGLAVGGARISPLHAGFVVNEGNATAMDIINLMEIVRNTVYDRFSVRLEPEVRIIGGSGSAEKVTR